MKTMNIKNGPQNVSRVIQGLMRMRNMSVEERVRVLKTDEELGINFYDNATCYGNGLAENAFGEAFAQAGIPREDVIIQTKCGIRFDRRGFDWRKDFILESVDESLERMKLDYLDVLLLHRPDLIYEPEQVAEAFDILEQSGKVRYFGVSNVPPMQLEYLKKYVKQPLVINQLQFSAEQTQLIDQTYYVNNMTTERSIDRDNGLIDYCRLNDITIQAWSPLQHGFFQGCFVDDERFPELNKALGQVAEKYGVSKTAAAIAWILRHPAKMQAIVGTMNVEHLKDIAQADKVEMTHGEWYDIYLTEGRFAP